MAKSSVNSEEAPELRLFLEEVCCNLCRFQHVAEENIAPEAVRVDTEFDMGVPNSFADIRVQSPDRAAYFLEVDYGYSADRMAASLARKYGSQSPGARGASKVVLVVDTHNHPDWPKVEARLSALVRPGLKLEIWDETHLIGFINARFGVNLQGISASELLDVRDAIMDAEKKYAFGVQCRNDGLESSLIWHFGFWRIKQLREGRSLSNRELFPPGLYRDSVVLIADLAGFSAYVRDTPEDRVVRECLTSFYAKSRYQIINSGGMMYQFLGDAAIAIFGVPQRTPGYPLAALDCAKSLLQIGDSVANEWQRQIDRVQPTGGVHIGITIGDVEIMSLRPFSRTHMGAVGDSINMAARLLNSATAGEIVASNTFYQRLDSASQAGFIELDAVEAKNVGRIRAWKLKAGGLTRHPAGAEHGAHND